jgi:hypothetical protein
MATISPALAARLEARRTLFNKQFALARRGFPDLDPAAFTGFLREILDPLVILAEKIDPGTLPAFIEAGYGIGIELTGKKIIGPEARSSALEKLWKTTFPAAIGLILNNPGPMLAKLSNAAHQLDVEAHARCDEWLSLVTALSPLCNDCPTLLALAQVCAWKCGMAHYRHGAIPLITALPAPLRAALFPLIDESNLPGEIERFLSDPWYTPARSAEKQRQPITYCTGGFRGLGGPFKHPPLAAGHEGKLLLWCDREWWIVHADVFGVTCKRLPAKYSANIPRPSEIKEKKSRSGHNGLFVEGGTVTVKGRSFDLSSEGTVSGAALASNTLLVSLENSHLARVFEVRKP